LGFDVLIVVWCLEIFWWVGAGLFRLFARFEIVGEPAPTGIDSLVVDRTFPVLNVLLIALWYKLPIDCDKIMEVQPREIRRYIRPDGRIPFLEWYYALRDGKAQVKIDARLERVSLGNFGDYKSVGDGVYELRINYGPGYRIYFRQVGTTIVLLLCGGDKSTQEQDILKAKEYSTDYETTENAYQR